MQGPVEREEEFIQRIHLLAPRRRIPAFILVVPVDSRRFRRDPAGRCSRSGWWDGRRDCEDGVATCSLIVSVDVGSADVDLYALIQSAITVPIQT